MPDTLPYVFQLVGSEVNNAAIYVDPYLVSNGEKSNKVGVSPPFDLMNGEVQGLYTVSILPGIPQLEMEQLSHNCMASVL